MLLAASARPSETPAAAPAVTRARCTRRAVTAMEYLVVISFILVVLIAGVQHLATMTRNVMQNDADATSATSTAR